MLVVVVTLAIIDLGMAIYKEIIEPPFLLIGVDSLQYLLGFFLWILIAIELLDSVRSYLRHRHFHVEAVLLVSLIAVARKVIVLDIHELSGVTIIGTATLIITLCGGYFLLRRCPPRTKEEMGRYESGGE